MIQLRKFILFFLSAFLLFPVSISAATIWIVPDHLSSIDSTLQARLVHLLDDLLIEENIPGISSAIVFDDSTMWLGATGMSDPVAQDSITSDMLFSIASITKTYISALTLLYAEEGEFDLEDSVYHFLPTYQNVDSTITIRQLLNHTSGVFSFQENIAFWDSMFNDHDRYWTTEDMINTFVWEPYFPPGDGWHYSNTNYLLLGTLLDEMFEDPVIEQLRNNILEPLGLERTYLELEDEIDEYIAHGWHDLDNDGEYEDISEFPRTAWYSAIWTGGAMVANAEEVARWIRTLFSGDVLEEASLELMLEFEEIPEGWQPFTGYGLGMGRIEIHDLTVWGHDGSIPGYSTIAIYVPVLDMSLCVLVNSDKPNSANRICYRLLETILNAQNVESYMTLNSYTSGELELDLYPNPTNSGVYISSGIPYRDMVNLSVYDVEGRLVKDFMQYSGERVGSIYYRPEGFSSGYYYIVGESSRSKTSKKFLFLK